MRRIIFFLISVLVFAGCQSSSQVGSEHKKIEARHLILKGLEDINNKNIKRSIIDLNEAIKANPSELEAFILLGQVLLREGQAEQASDVFMYAAHIFPNNGTVFYMWAIANNAAGKKREALEAAHLSAEIFSKKKTEEVYLNGMYMAMILWRGIS